MTDISAFEPTHEGEADDGALGLSLSELLGEVWAPVGRAARDERDITSARSDADSGDPAPWNL